MKTLKLTMVSAIAAVLTAISDPEPVPVCTVVRYATTNRATPSSFYVMQNTDLRCVWKGQTKQWMLEYSWISEFAVHDGVQWKTNYFTATNSLTEVWNTVFPVDTNQVSVYRLMKAAEAGDRDAANELIRRAREEGIIP